jgi:lysophospholipase L1-like esterase
VAGVPELNLEDGLHPTAAGHEKLAEVVAPRVAELLGTPR